MCTIISIRFNIARWFVIEVTLLLDATNVTEATISSVMCQNALDRIIGRIIGRKPQRTLAHDRQDNRKIDFSSHILPENMPI